ncbi:hypothetical protein QL285_030092 [Trifolium repens]|nr:hypothetical protein QL285_030092 [Trifolium repens]
MRFTERDNIREFIRKKNAELDLEVCELRKLKEKWVDDSNALAEPRKRVCVLEKNNEGEKSTKTNSEALHVPMITDFEDRDEDNVGEYEIDNDIVEPNPLQSNEPPSKKSKKDQGSSSESIGVYSLKITYNAIERFSVLYSSLLGSYSMTETRGTTVDAAHSRHGNPITSFCRECVARHAPIVEEPQQNANAHMSEEVVVMGGAVVPPSDMQEQMAINFISLVHQERYSNFLANKKFVEEKIFRFEGEKFSDIQTMIVLRGWEELTSFAKDASMRLAKEFFANAYQDPAKEDGNNKNDLKKFASFVRGKEVPFHDKIINELFRLENYEQCSFEARKAKGSIIDHQEIRSTLCRDKADWVRNKDGTPSKLRTSDLTPNAKAWAIFVLRTLLPCSNTSDLTIQKASLVTAILKGERVNVGRILADDLCGTANCSNPSSYISHASLISKLCERVEVYPEKNEEMVKPSGAITAKWIEKHCTGDIVKNRSNCM